MRAPAALMLLLLPAPSLAAEVDGRFVLAVPDDQVQATLDKAVDDAVQNVSWMFRGIARPRLEKVATACPAFDLALDGPDFRVQCEGKDLFTWQVGKRGPWTDENGKTITVSLERAGDRLTLDFAGEQGGLKNTYALREGGITLTKQIYSEHLSEPMTWTLDYAAK